MGALLVSVCALGGCSGGLQHAEEAAHWPLQPTLHTAHGPGGTPHRRRPLECRDRGRVPGSSISHDALLRTGLGLWADCVCGGHVLHPSAGHPLTLLRHQLRDMPPPGASVVRLRGDWWCGLLCGQLFGPAMQPHLSPDQSLHPLARLSVHVPHSNSCSSNYGLCHCWSGPVDTVLWFLILGVVAIAITLAQCSVQGIFFFFVLLCFSASSKKSLI